MVRALIGAHSLHLTHQHNFCIVRGSNLSRAEETAMSKQGLAVTLTLVVLCPLGMLFSMPAVTYIFSTIDDPDADTVHGERTHAYGINSRGDTVGTFGRH